MLIPAVAKAADAPDVTIEDIYADLCFAVPRVSIQDVADKWRTEWDGSDVPAALKEIGTAGLAGLQLGTRLGKQL